MAQTASAANLYVDDDGVQCPAATYTSVQSAVDAAVLGDTVVVCEGIYSEGPGTEGTNGLTISKSIDIKGAGAEKVTIQPTRATPTGGQIAAASPVLRDGIGNIISITGTPEAPITVDISGVTVSGGGDKTYFDPNIEVPLWNGEFENGVYSEAGVVFLDAGGSFNNSSVTNVVTSERSTAESLPGGYRSNTVGWGLAQVSAAIATPAVASVPIEIKGSRFERYNRGGILIDGAISDTFPLTQSGNPQEASIIRSTIIGRQLNSPPLDGSGGGTLLTTGTEFGQDGVRVTSGSALSLNASDVFQNLPAGAGSNVIGKLDIASGLRFIDAAASTASNSNIEQNGYGIINVQADGTTANTATPVTAYNNWWGLRAATGTVSTPVVNDGPGVSPVALPTRPNNPVNGTVDANFGSDAVHFKDVANSINFRSGNEADTNGHWPTAETPAPIVDAAPTVSLESSLDTVAPGGTITLTADAADDFGVKKITFFKGDTELGSVVPPANSVEWTAPPACGVPQTVEFTVFVEDSEGQESFSDVSVDVDDCAPTVDASATANDGLPLGSVIVSANASDDLGLASLEFYEDGVLFDTINSPVNGVSSATFVPAELCNGDTYSFEVVATDSTGHETTDQASFSQADCPPVVQLAADQTTVAPGGTVNLTATAEDDIMAVSMVFFDSAGEFASATNSTENPWVKTQAWTAPNECGQSSDLEVLVTDVSNQIGNSNTVTVNTTPCVDAPPTVELAANPTAVDAGGDVTLTATATDDDAVSSLTFFEGSTQIGSVTPPNNSIVWTSPDTCNASFNLKVVAEDTAAQTAEDTVTVTTNACPPPAEPTVSIDSPPASIAQNGTTVGATAAGEAGITKVSFHIGTRQVCEDTTAPYSCSILPQGNEVGASSIRAVVTDSLGRTAEDIETTAVAKFKPKGLNVNTKRIGKKKVRMKVYGKVLMPARMSAATGCKASRVDITAKLGKKSLTNKQVKLASDCTYGLVFGAPKTKKKQKVVIKVRFPGNAKLTATSKIRKVR